MDSVKVIKETLQTFKDLKVFQSNVSNALIVVYDGIDLTNTIVRDHIQKITLNQFLIAKIGEANKLSPETSMVSLIGGDGLEVIRTKIKEAVSKKICEMYVLVFQE